jgi:signal transduction histidine kinase
MKYVPGRFLPKTLFGRILLAMFCGLLAVQAVGVWLMLEDRARFGERLLGEYVAQRIAGIIGILEDAQPAERTRLVRALSTAPIRLSLDEAWHAGDLEDSDDAKAFTSRLGRELERPMRLQVLSIRSVERRDRKLREEGGPRRETPEAGSPRRDFGEGSPPDRLERPGRGGRGPFLVVTGQAMLTDGTVVTFRRALPQPSLEWPIRALVLLAVLGLFVAFVAGWALRKVTRPLASLADAASGLARDLNRPPLPETGPQEVARAAQAFNAMQKDLRRHLETRAHALAGVSHDLRLPLTRLRLRLERLPEGELRTKIEEDIGEMDAMIRSTLEYLSAGSAAEKPVRLNLNSLLDGVVEDMEPLGAKISKHGEASAPILAQPQAIRRCLSNLLENARRYGGEEIDLRILDSADEVEIRVEDRGPGIPEDDRDRVFEPYVRLEASRAKHTGGTGLGLAIARAIARANGGDITLETRMGGGLAAVLRLPRRADEKPPAADNVLVPVHKFP